MKPEIRWKEFKHEIFTLLYLVIVPTWVNFQIPMYARLGFPLNIIVTGLIAAGGIFLYCTVFLYPEIYSATFNAEWLDDSPNPKVYKKIFKTIRLLMFCGAAYYYWYIDFFGMPTIYYVLCYANFFVIELFFERIMKRYKKRLQ